MSVMHTLKLPTPDAAITEAVPHIGCEIGDCQEDHPFRDHEDHILVARAGWWEHHGVHFCPVHAPDPFVVCPN